MDPTMGNVPAWAVRLNAERRERLWSQREMARRLSVIAEEVGVRLSPTRESLTRMISDWEAGRHKPKDPYRVLYARAFGLGEADLFGEPSTRSEPDPPTGPDAPGGPDGPAAPELPWVWEPRSTTDAVYRITRDDLMLDRRQAVVALAVTAGLPLIDPAQRWLINTPDDLPETSPDGRIGPDEVAHLEATVAVFRGWDHAHGGGLARKAVIGQLNQVADILRESHPPDITVRLFHVMAQLAKVAATMSWDCGMQTAAQKYYVLALQAAKPAGDRPFGASILASMARQLLYLDKPRDALELVRLALDGVRVTGTPRLRAMLRTREAWAYAALGRPEAFKRATDAAHEAFGEIRDSDPDPGWIAYFDAAELAGVTGGRYLEMARRDPRHSADAVTYIGEALRLRAQAGTRSLALDRIGLARAYLLRGDLDAAVEVGGVAMDAVGQVQSDRVRGKLRKLYEEISARHDPVADDLNRRIRDELAR